MWQLVVYLYKKENEHDSASKRTHNKQFLSPAEVSRAVSGNLRNQSYLEISCDALFHG
jgi:hypothetical protein